MFTVLSPANLFRPVDSDKLLTKLSTYLLPSFRISLHGFISFMKWAHLRLWNRSLENAIKSLYASVGEMALSIPNFYEDFVSAIIIC